MREASTLKSLEGRIGRCHTCLRTDSTDTAALIVEQRLGDEEERENTKENAKETIGVRE